MGLKAHIKYAKYLLRHKWFVFLGCCEMGIPLQGLLHDWSKLTPTEWFPYVNHFYGKKPSPRDKTGAYDPLQVGSDFDAAWLSHQHHNPHHWQYWILRGDNGNQKALPMPYRYILEMVLDWRGAGLAQGKPDVEGWYWKNRDKMVLHPDTQARVEVLLRAIRRLT
jgi:hypothetical protein